MAGESAKIGEPPANERDLHIVKGLLVLAGLYDVDPRKGAKLPPSRPPPDRYHYETRGPNFIGGCIAAIIIILSVTITRLAIRIMGKGLRFGWDDWVIIPGVVCNCSRRKDQARV